jgi:predicted AlkP superfamily phosphohydrolase/phosphomutase
MTPPLIAYVGPGAGFAFLGGFLTLITGFFLTAVSFLLWPLRMARALLLRRQGLRKAKVERVIFLGLDGLDPRLTERFMSEGRLPHLQRLREQGSFHRLRTTFPALSPVAWSTFATGVNPAKHNIFDFLNRSLKSYAPELSSSRVRPSRRVLRAGRFRIPLSRPVLELRRKSQPFWKILSDCSIGSTIIRVPITFPPEKFEGRLLSAMCTPDLRGTQGSFTEFTTRLDQPTYENGMRCPLRRKGASLEGTLEGPENEFLEQGGAIAAPFCIRLGEGAIVLEVAGKSVMLRQGQYSPWVRIPFQAAPGINIHGIARVLVTENAQEFSMYVTPIQIDPESPALPISHPAYYAVYLAKLLGSFATVGMAEDTWALNEGVISERAFLDQAWSLFAERQAMFRNALAHTKRGVVACVFDTSDRVQHMFYRHLEGRGDPQWRDAIAEMYERMDRLAGDVMEIVDAKTALFVLSDHGFCGFRRAVNLNSWLHQNGYLALKNDMAESGRYFANVDWTRTRAYSMGLSGLYINLEGREGEGIVRRDGEADALKRDLIARLSGLRDEELDQIAIRQIYSTSDLYKGPYLDAAPDMIVGYHEGYRTSWDAAVGKVTGHVIEDNPKAWSGDHCVDPVLVPGVLFSNRRIDCDNPGIEDMAPTALDLFGIDPPAWMDGKPLCVAL